MLFEPELRLYSIQNDTYRFHTGALPDGRQVLMGVQFPELVVVEFDAEGNYSTLFPRDIPANILRISKHDTYSADRDLLDEEIRKLQQTIGYSPATIHVKQFFLADRWIGIKDLPDYLVETMEGSDTDDLEVAEAKEEIRTWQENGDFVLWWCKDIWLDASGAITST